jgi:hypothetical protein
MEKARAGAQVGHATLVAQSESGLMQECPYCGGTGWPLAELLAVISLPERWFQPTFSTRSAPGRSGGHNLLGLRLV